MEGQFAAQIGIDDVPFKNCQATYLCQLKMELQVYQNTDYLTKNYEICFSLNEPMRLLKMLNI